MENDENNKKETYGEQEPGGSKITIEKDFQFQGGPGLLALLKFLVKVSAPPGPGAKNRPVPAPTEPADGEAPEAGETGPGETSGPSAGGFSKPGSIEPSSSGWLIWLAVIACAAFYWFYTGAR